MSSVRYSRPSWKWKRAAIELPPLVSAKLSIREADEDSKPKTTISLRTSSAVQRARKGVARPTTEGMSTEEEEKVTKAETEDASDEGLSGLQSVAKNYKTKSENVRTKQNAAVTGYCQDLGNIARKGSVSER